MRGALDVFLPNHDPSNLETSQAANAEIHPPPLLQYNLKSSIRLGLAKIYGRKKLPSDCRSHETVHFSTHHQRIQRSPKHW